MSYTPKPIDTSNIGLPEEVTNLIEELAENTHNQWAAQRIKDGWVYGKKRDDYKKEHPCLIAYNDLPDGEKEYDRITASNALKLIIKLGWKITKD